MLAFDDLGYVDWPEQSVKIAGRAIDDVAYALGYKGATAYNGACHDRPDEVLARLAAL